MSLDNEWLDFLEEKSLNQIDNNQIDNNQTNHKHINDNTHDNVHDNFEYNATNCDYNYHTNRNIDNIDSSNDNTNMLSKCSDLYISTKTIILFINSNIDIYNLFWKIPLINYDQQSEGIIKKQIKISLFSQKEIDDIENKLNNYTNVKCNILSHLDNPNNVIKFKHVRKISIGIDKKDLLFNNKDKSAFYNCFVIILRIFYEDMFREIHVKIFNTGKIEIPGLQGNKITDIVINKLNEFLQNYADKNIYVIEKSLEIILINSNFNCGFYIDREKLYLILRNKYNINAIYDPCSYPGIRCIYYYNENNKKLKISYMIFRTGSILIVGKCDENYLNIVYNYIKTILNTEYKNILINNINKEAVKKKKCKKKYIYVNN